MEQLKWPAIKERKLDRKRILVKSDLETSYFLQQQVQYFQTPAHQDGQGIRM